MEDICNFIPPKKHESELDLIHFVYETGIKRLTQPFSHFYYRMFLVFKGTAVFKVEGKRISLKRGDVFFVFPYQSYEFDYEDGFCYFYISFCGNGAMPLLKSMGISEQNCWFGGLENVVDFWVDSVRSQRVC